VRVRLADADAGASREVLMAAAFGREVGCSMEADGPLGPTARCLADGVSLGVLMRLAHVRQQAADWR
jgi:hypothetical protein